LVGVAIRGIVEATGRSFVVDSQAVVCTSGGAHVVLEDCRSGVGYIRSGDAGEGLVILMCSALGPSAWRCSSS